MPKFQVSGYLTISVVKTVTARNAAHARKIAQGLAAPSLCWQCESAGESDPEAWELNGFDDPPDDAVRHIEKEKA